MLRSALALVFTISLSVPGYGASFAGVRVVPDGSLNPPGDRVEVDVLFYPGDEAVDVELRPLAVPADAEDAVERPVRGNGPHVDRAGDYVQKVSVLRGDTPVATATIVVAYADLALGDGTYVFGYQVTGLRGGRVEFTAASPTTRLVVSDEPREVEPFREVPGEATDETPLTVILPDPAADGGFRIVEKNRADRPAEPDRVPTGGPPVTIPRGFTRQYFFAAAPANAAETPLDAEVARLATAGWVPRPTQVLYFATNRNLLDPVDRSVGRYGIDADARVRYGSVRVNVPAEHVAGRLERPRWWRRPDPRRHFFVDGVNALDRDGFLGALRPALTDNRTDVLVYVHGFNTSFEFAALRLAQFKNDVRFGGQAVFFSWPSAGSPGEYERDERLAASSEDALKSVLSSLVAECRDGGRSRKIHLLAHSMGNRVLLGALGRLAAELEPGEKPFGHLVLAAPDVDVRRFVGLLPRAAKGAETVSLYFNRDDRALQLSRAIHLDSRVGEAAVFMVPLLNIDARRANTSILGHDLFVSRDVVLVDLEMLLNLDLPPAGRSTLRPAADGENDYWMFP